jgi:glycosyltransferase involved in cell wall biosynthesis
MVKSVSRLAIVTTHPIQYNAPLFKLLSERKKITIMVFYTWSQARHTVFDPGFDRERKWDIPLLEGYPFTFVNNKAGRPGSHHFWGVQNPGLIGEIEDWQPDGLLVYGWSFYSHLTCLVHFKNKIPVFFRGDSTLIDETSSWRSLVRRTVLKWVYRHVDTAFYVGTNNKAYFREHGLKVEQLVFAPHAVDNRRFLEITKEEEAVLADWKHQLGFAPDDWVVLFVGKLEEKKNPAFLLELAKEMPEPNLKFLLVGNGKLEAALKQQNKDKRVIFLEFQNQSLMPLVYRLGHVLVLPSKGPGETWGLAANEALCCGLPVILSSKVGGAPDLVQEEGNGITFQLDQIEKVKDFIRHLYKNKEAYLQSPQNAVRHIQRFSLDKVAEAIENALEFVVKK